MRYLSAAALAVFLCLPFVVSAQGPYSLNAGVTWTDPVPANSDSYDVELTVNAAVVQSLTGLAGNSAGASISANTGDEVCARARGVNFILTGNWSTPVCITIPAAPADLSINLTLTMGS